MYFTHRLQCDNDDDDDDDDLAEDGLADADTVGEGDGGDDVGEVELGEFANANRRNGGSY